MPSEENLLIQNKLIL